MKDNQLQICSFEQAQRLKAAGFSWDCNQYYELYCSAYYNGNVANYNDGRTVAYNRTPVISAPTVALALKWMRDVKGKYNWSIDCAGVDDYIYFIDTKIYGGFSTYEAAESALLDKLLNVLETNKNE